MYKEDLYNDTCTFCSVKMFGSGAYTDKESGEIVRFDYIKPENLDDFCRKHCDKYKPEVEVYLEDSLHDKTVKK